MNEITTRQVAERERDTYRDRLGVARGLLTRWSKWFVGLAIHRGHGSDVDADTRSFLAASPVSSSANGATTRPQPSGETTKGGTDGK